MKVFIKPFVFIVYVVLIMVSMPLHAHHAMEYIKMESYSTAKKGEFVAHLHYDYKVDNNKDPSLDHWEITPGISYGIIDRLMFDIHTHFAKFNQGHVAASEQAAYPDGPSPFMEAIASSLQFRITDEGQLPVDIAAAATFELPLSRAKDLLGAEMVYGGAIIFGWSYGLHNNITANFTYEGEGGEHSFGWALGFKFVLSLDDEHAPACGIEILGDFKGALGIMPGLYIGITPNTTFKTGIGIGLHDYDDDLRAHVSLQRRW
ncbi:MAG: hypothetical protein GY754_25750 [bacterium]|nr:hypothetical protein [bacterium]